MHSLIHIVCGCKTANYRSVPGKRPCTSFQGVNVAASIQTYGNYVPGKHPCGTKSRCMLKCPWALTRDTMVMPHSFPIGRGANSVVLAMNLQSLPSLKFCLPIIIKIMSLVCGRMYEVYLGVGHTRLATSLQP